MKINKLNDILIHNISSIIHTKSLHMNFIKSKQTTAYYRTSYTKSEVPKLWGGGFKKNNTFQKLLIYNYLFFSNQIHTYIGTFG